MTPELNRKYLDIRPIISDLNSSFITLGMVTSNVTNCKQNQIRQTLCVCADGYTFVNRHKPVLSTPLPLLETILEPCHPLAVKQEIEEQHVRHNQFLNQTNNPQKKPTPGISCWTFTQLLSLVTKRLPTSNVSVTKSSTCLMHTVFILLVQMLSSGNFKYVH